MRKTKIVCTLGPSTDDEAVLRELILSGMNVARLNMCCVTAMIPAGKKLRILQARVYELLFLQIIQVNLTVKH